MSNQIKNVVINAKDLWTAITNCKYVEGGEMSLLRTYFRDRGICADSLFHGATFDSKTGDVTFTVKHKSFPEVASNEEIKSFRLPGLRNKNEPA